MTSRGAGFGALCAVCSAAALVSACVPEWVAPKAAASIVAVREANDTESSSAIATYRVLVAEGPAVERYGIVIRVSSNARKYWVTEFGEFRIPSGGTVTGAVRVDFAEASERYEAESAVVESSWFE